jgi:tetratricopeptide (TPR) repeat protein
VRAVVACVAIEAALDLLGRLDAEGDTQKVRWNMAVALGDRLPALPPDQPAHKHAVLLLEHLLDGIEPTVRAEAVSALGRAGTPEVMPLLERRAAIENDIGVATRIIEALGSLRLPEGGGVIGRILARSKEGQATLEPAAREALAAIAKDRGPEQWLLLGEAVSGAGAHTLAVTCYRELIKEYEDKPEHKDAVQRARGRMANDLYLAGRPVDALTVLVELEESQAPYPSQIERLELSARCCESLDRFGEAAGFHLKRYELLPEGEAQRTATLKAAVTALSKAGRHSEALDYLRELAAADPENNQLLYDLAREEEATGKLDQAEETLVRLMQRIPSDDASFLGDVKAALTRVQNKARGLVPLQDEQTG